MGSIGDRCEIDELFIYVRHVNTRWDRWVRYEFDVGSMNCSFMLDMSILDGIDGFDMSSIWDRYA